MLHLLADEDFNHSIVRGLICHKPNLDIVCAQEVGLSGEQDPVVLEWAAKESRILLTHDVNTMLEQAYARVKAGLPMPGVFAINQSLPVGKVISVRL